MKKYLLICVTYHSDEALHTFVESVHRAAEQVKETMSVDIQVADNGQNNLGYLGGALPIYNAKAQGYDFVSISNVDMELAPDFFKQLLKMDISDNGWLAPDIYTGKINRHENPYMLSRPTQKDFLIWSIIYSCTWIYSIYHCLHLLKNKQHKVYPECTIYAGHGSFMLFTKAFVQNYPSLQFPGFMYAEEIFFAELVQRAHLRALYSPLLHINNTGNINTGKINQAQKSQWNKDSLRVIYEHFF